MRHKNNNKILGREKGPRTSLYRATATNLFVAESIKTTLAKAKAIRPFTEKLITKAKSGTLHDLREVTKDIHDKDVVKKLFNDIAKRFEKRNGGYTRIVKIGPRPNDGAEMAIFELVEKVEKVKPVKTTKKAEKKAEQSTPATTVKAEKKVVKTKKATTKKEEVGA